MAVSDDDERFWRMVWPKLEAGAWRYERQAGRVAHSPSEVSTEASPVEDRTDDDAESLSGGMCILTAESGRCSGGDCRDKCDSLKTEGQNNPKAQESKQVPVFFPPPQGVANEALEEAMRRNLPADGSAGAGRPDRFERVDAVIELLTQVPGFPAAMTYGTAPNMEAVAAAAEAVSSNPTIPPVVSPPVSRVMESLPRRLKSTDNAANEQPDVQTEETSTDKSTDKSRAGRVIRKPVKLEANPGPTLPSRTMKLDAPGKVTARSRCVSESSMAGAERQTSREVIIVDDTKPSVGCNSPVTGFHSGPMKPVGNKAENGSPGYCSGGGERVAGKSGGGSSAVNGRSKSGSSSSGDDDSWRQCSSGALVGNAGLETGRDSAEVILLEAGTAGDENTCNTPAGKAKNVMVTPSPPPERPVGCLGKDPTETVKEYKRAFEDVIWPALVYEFEWTRVIGPRPTDSYFMPKGVVRGKGGAKCREDYFDSHKQVITHMVENEDKYREILELAWAAAIATPRAPARSVASKQKRKKASRRRSVMMEKEFPQKVSIVGEAHQVDPANMCPCVSKEEYVPPDDVAFEQVWAPLPLGPNGEQSRAPDELVREFAGVVSHDKAFWPGRAISFGVVHGCARLEPEDDGSTYRAWSREKCLEILFRCGGDLARARALLNNLLRMWKARYPEAALGLKAMVEAREVVESENKVYIAAMKASPRSPSSLTSVAAGPNGGNLPNGNGGQRATGTLVAAALGAARNVTGVARTTRASVAGALCWGRGQRVLLGGEAALKRQIEGGLSCRPPGGRSRDKLSLDLNLTRPWSVADMETFTRVLLGEGGKNFYVVQKALPNRQICELADRYYGGWKRTSDYATLKESISLAKLQSVCWVCQTGGDLICCEGCDAVYHVPCVGLSVVPDGDWYCVQCVKNKKNMSSKESQETVGSAAVAANSNNPQVCLQAGNNSASGKKKKGRSMAGESSASGVKIECSSLEGTRARGPGGGPSSSSVGRTNVSGVIAAAGRPPAKTGLIERVPIHFGNSQQQQQQQRNGGVVRSPAARSGTSKAAKRPRTSSGKKNQEITPAPPKSCAKLEQKTTEAARSSLPSISADAKPISKTPIRASKASATIPVASVPAPTPVHVPTEGTPVSATGVVASAVADIVGISNDVTAATKSENDWWLCMTCSIFNHTGMCRRCSGPKPADDDDMDEDDEDIDVDVVAVGVVPGGAVRGGMFGANTVPTSSFALALPPT